MKRKMTRLLVCVCCVAMLFTAFGTFAYAHEIDTSKNAAIAHPVQQGYKWYPISYKASDTANFYTEQKETYFVIHAMAGTHREDLYISFPQEGGFRLQSQHDVENRKEPDVSNVGLFEPSSIKVIDYNNSTPGVVVMKGTDNTEVRFSSNDSGFTLEISNAKDRKIVYITSGQISYAYDRLGNILRTMVEMPLVNKEAIYNGSMRFQTPNVVGTHFSLTNADCWSYEDYSYGNVPLFHSNRGYSIWFNMTYPGEADMGETNPEKYSIKLDGDKLDFYLWTGEPLDNLKKYTSLTGTSGMSEEWTFGFWSGAMSAAFDGNYHKNAEENMIMLFEDVYHNKYNFYPEAFYGEGKNSQNANSMLFAQARGSKVLYWFYPASGMSTMPEYLPEMTKSTPIFDADGKCISTGYPYIYTTPLLKLMNIYSFSQTTWYDFSNPSSIDVIKARMWQLWQWGLAGAMIDYGENLSFSGTCFNGLSGMEMHNLNSYYYAKNANIAWTDYYAENTEHANDFVLFERSTVAGAQYWSGNFLGDQRSTWEGYQKAIYDMISMGAGGYNLYGADIGGLGGTPQNDLWNRWVVLGTFSPYMRQHGSDIHMSTKHGITATENFGKYYYLRKNLVPSVMSAAMDANQTANPMVKGMMMAYPYQLWLGNVNNQYLFCDDFLVCPVTETSQYTQRVYLPSGHTWYSLFTYDKFAGGNKKGILVEAPANFMPVFVKDGAVKALNLPETMKLSDEMHDEEDASEGLTFAPETVKKRALLITPPDNERSSTIYTKSGYSTDYRTYDYTTEIYTSTPNGSDFTVSIEDEKSTRRIVLALGVCASKITVDGVELQRLDHMPDYYNDEIGYYVDLEGLTTILMPSTWTSLSITKGEVGHKQVALAPFDKQAVESMLNDSLNDYYDLPLSGSTEVQIANNEIKEIGMIKVRWTTGFAATYDIEYSEDGDNWSLIEPSEEEKYIISPDDEERYIVFDDEVHTVTVSDGGIDTIKFDPVEAAYLRITKHQDGDTLTMPGIYSFEVYEPDSFTPIPVDEGDEDDGDDLWDEDEDDEDDGDDSWDEEDPDEPDDSGDDNNTDSKKKKRIKRIITSYFPVWAIILIVGGGVLLATGIVLLVLLLIKRKKKQEAEAALAAEGETPTDFPNPPPA